MDETEITYEQVLEHWKTHKLVCTDTQYGVWERSMKCAVGCHGVLEVHVCDRRFFDKDGKMKKSLWLDFLHNRTNSISSIDG